MYVQKQDLSALSEEINRPMYPRDVDSTVTGANKDPHVTFFGEIVDGAVFFCRCSQFFKSSTTHDINH